MPQQIVVAVPADVRNFDNYSWHAAPGTYLKALALTAGAFPVIVPALTLELDVARLLERVDGLLLTGSASNVHPDRYGRPPSAAHEPFDQDRDALTATLILSALERGLPMLCLCRGHQELNVALGGTLATEIQEFEGRMDHRAPVHDQQHARFAIRHPVTVTAGGVLSRIVGDGEIQVNSLHRQAIDRLGDGLSVEAVAPDGTIEAVSVESAKAFALGVQWHPEYWAGSDEPSAAIFSAFGQACRDYAAELNGR